MHRFFIALCLLPVACASSTNSQQDTGRDATTETATDVVPDQTSNDTGPSDVVSDSGPTQCGTEVCTASQVCVVTSSGVGQMFQCHDLPAGCNGTITCDCLTSICPQSPPNVCMVTDHTASCGCPTCP